jgi:hypothetical protein
MFTIFVTEKVFFPPIPKIAEKSKSPTAKQQLISCYQLQYGGCFQSPVNFAGQIELANLFCTKWNGDERKFESTFSSNLLD